LTLKVRRFNEDDNEFLKKKEERKRKKNKKIELMSAQMPVDTCILFIYAKIATRPNTMSQLFGSSKLANICLLCRW